MEFLVNIKINWPESVPEERRDHLRKTEAAHIPELANKGHLLRMWRVPGRRENWGLWQAVDATEMHEVLTSMPIWPYMDVTVHAVGRHAMDPAADRES